MKAYRKSIVPLFCLLLAVVVACGSDGTYMRQQLAELQDKNLADSVLNDTTLAETLAAYFDDHGTLNERLESHYLLARTWTDVGDAPRALDEFQKAAALADTTSLDSLGGHWLSRIYGQMGELLFQHQLPRNALMAYQKAYQFARDINETLISACYYEQQGKCYYDLNLEDSVAFVMHQSMMRYLACGDTLRANTAKGPISYLLINKGEYEKAKGYLEDYEYRSLLTQQYLALSEEWKLLYYYKGYYHQHLGQADSALYYYYKELQVSDYPNNKGLTYGELSHLYHSLGNSDSVAKYAMLYAEETSGFYKESVSSALLSMQHLYDYNHFKSLAQDKAIEAEQTKRTMLYIVFLFLMAGAFAFRQYKNSQNEKRRLADRIQLLRGYAVNKNLYDSPVANHFRQLLKANPYHQPDAKDWKELTALIETEIPGFRKALSNEAYTPSDIEYDVCMLIKIQIPLSDIARLKHCVPSYITQIRKNVYKNLFSKKGSANELDEYIMQLR